MLIILFSILTATITYVIAATPSTKMFLSSGDYPTTTNYLIFKDGSTYYSKNSHGQVVYSGTNATYVMQQTADALSRGKITVKGSITLDGEVMIKSNQEWDLTESYILQGRSGSTYTDLFVVGWFGYAPYNVYIHGGILDGNKGSTIGHGIEIICKSGATNSTDYAYNITVSNVRLQNIEGTGILLLNASRCIISNNVFFNIGNDTTHFGPAVRLDHFTTNCLVTNNIMKDMNEHGIRVYDNCTHNVISNNIIEHAEKTCISVTGPYNVISNNVLKDCDYTHVLSVSGDYCIVDGNFISESYNSSGQYMIRAYDNIVVSNNIIYGGYDGIMVNSNCTVIGNRVFNVTYYSIHLYLANFSQVSGNMVYGAIGSTRGIRIEDTNQSTIGSNTFTNCYYGISELAGCDLNMIVGVNTRGCTNGIITVGANTKANLCWNATTWIA